MRNGAYVLIIKGTYSQQNAYIVAVSMFNVSVRLCADCSIVTVSKDCIKILT